MDQLRDKLVEDYWLTKLSKADEVLNHARNGWNPDGARVMREVMLEPAALVQLNALTRGNSLSKYTAYLAVYTLLLRRYFPDVGIMVAAPGIGLDEADTPADRLIFLTVGAPLESTFKEYLEHTREEIRQTAKYQCYDYQAIREGLIPKGVAEYRLLQFGLEVDAGDGCPALLQDVAVKLRITERPGGALEVRLTHQENAVPEGYLVHFAEQVGNVLACVKDSLHQPAYTLPWLTAAERQQLLVAFNDTNRQFPGDESVVDVFERQAARTPEAVALRFEGRAVTYRELNEASNRLAHCLQEVYKVGAERLVGLMADRSERMVIGLLGILKAGGAYLPIDPQYPEARKEFILKDAGISLLLTDSDFMFSMPGYAGEVFVLDIQLEGLTESTLNLHARPRAGDLAYVIYTSGSTGNPKGVMIEHGSCVNMITDQVRQFGVTAEDRVLLFASLSFDASVSEIGMALLTGATLVLVSREVINDLDRFVAYLREHRVTVVTLPPAYLKSLNLEQITFLRTIITAGEAAPAECARRWHQYGQYFNAYGPTECAVCVTIYRMEAMGAADDAIPIGKPIANTRVYVVDEYGQLVPAGVKGELLVAGAGLARGYLNREELTREKFIPSPFVPGDVLYRTGDLVRWLPGGNLVFMGRKDEQIKIRAYRVEPAEVEKTLLEFGPASNAVVVVHTAGNEPELVAYLTGPADLDTAAARSFLAGRLPEYMVPGRFVRLDRLPLNANGKIDRMALAAQPDLPLTRPYVPPHNALQAQMAAIWQEVLQKEKIGIRDDFFELGGHSLKGIQIIALMHSRLGLNLDLRTVFAHPTVEALAEATQPGRDQYEAIPTVPAAESYEVSHAQRRLYFIHQLEEDQVAYNTVSATVLTGLLDEEALERSVRMLVKRHEILRTVFVSRGGEPRQKVCAPESAPYSWSYHDLRGEGNPEGESQMLIDKVVHQKFDLARGPLWRTVLIRVADDRCIFLCVMHHIISDGWSMQILEQEISTLYHTALKGGPDLLPALPVQYKDFATWQNEQLRGDALAPHRAYWAEQFSGELPVLELPTSFARPLVKTFRSRSVRFALDGDDWKTIQALGEQWQASRFMLLLASVKALLFRYSGQDDLIAGIPVAGREHYQLRNQVGFYLSTLAIRTRLDEDESFSGLVGKIKSATLNAYAHQIYPFDRLVDDLRLHRDISRSALFDVLVVSESFDAPAGTAPPEAAAAGFAMAPYPVSFSANKYDLTFYFKESADELCVTLAYNADLFTEERAERMVAHYRQLTRLLIRHADRPMMRHDYLTESEKGWIAGTFNQTQVPYAKEKTLHQLFEEQVRRNPRHAAVRQDGVDVSYDALNRQANQLARYLMDKGVANGDNVGLITTRNATMLTGMLGILKAGAAYVPIDPEYPVERQQYLISNSGIRVVMTDGVYPVAGTDPAVTFLTPEAVVCSAYADSDLGLPKSSEDLAYVIYTSGSTGRPKGVMIAHHAAVNLVEWVNREFGVGAGDRLLFITSMCFDLSVYDIFGTLAAGGTVVIARKEEVQDAAALRKLLIDEAITCWNSVPTTMNYLVSDLETSPEPFVQEKLRIILMSGDWIPVKLPGRLKPFFPRAQVVSLGGATEGTVWSNYYPVRQVQPNWASIPYGKPIANNFFYILDRALNPVPEGVTGELYIGGTGVSLGYINNATITSQAFVRDPFNDQLGGRMYRTGDLGRLMPDGNMEFLGRKDQQIKIRGHRVELGEIETTLLNYPGVEQALVSVVNDKAGARHLAAYYTLAQEVTAQDLKDFLSGKLPAYVIPAYYVPLSAFPLNSNGKIDRKALPDPLDLLTTRTDDVVAPRNETEASLVAIWQSVLNRQQIGIHDNFFEIGGHSLSANQVVSRVQVEMDIKMKLRSLFMCPTIADLSLEIEALRWVTSSLRHSPMPDVTKQIIL